MHAHTCFTEITDALQREFVYFKWIIEVIIKITQLK